MRANPEILVSRAEDARDPNDGEAGLMFAVRCTDCGATGWVFIGWQMLISCQSLPFGQVILVRLMSKEMHFKAYMHNQAAMAQAVRERMTAEGMTAASIDKLPSGDSRGDA